MSQHRQHYIEANFRPEHEPALESSIGRGIVIALVAIAAIGSAVSYAHSRLASEEPVVTPVRLPEVVHYSLPPIELYEARSEGYRAGMAEGLAQQGCTPTLTSPITTR
jgi:hypothetical protein